MNKHAAGFTLVEIAIVLIIVGLLIGGLITPLQTQIEQRRTAETQHALEEAREALIGYAMQNGYLPCPAISVSNGLEDRNGTNCTEGRRSGFLPWATLGLGRLDSWNHLYHYSVTPGYTNSDFLFTMRTPRDISIATRDGAGELAPATGVNDIVAVVMSYGKNGYGASTELGTTVLDTGQANADEKLNNGGDGTKFITRPASDNRNQPGGEFDDVLVWLSPNILFNRMVAAQRLP